MEKQKIYKAIELLEFTDGTKFEDINNGMTVEVIEMRGGKYLKGGATGSLLYFTSILLEKEFIRVEK